MYCQSFNNATYKTSYCTMRKLLLFNKIVCIYINICKHGEDCVFIDHVMIYSCIKGMTLCRV